MKSHHNTVMLTNQAFTGTSVHNGSAVVTEAAGSPNQGVARSKWERRYAANLRITDTVVVCGAVILAQYVRFGQAPTAPSVSHYVTAYSALLAIIWLSALAVIS